MDTTQTHQFSDRSTPNVAPVFTDDSRCGTVTLGPLGFLNLISTLTLMQQCPNYNPGTNPPPSTASPHEAPLQLPAHSRSVSCLQHGSLLTHWSCTQTVSSHRAQKRANSIFFHAAFTELHLIATQLPAAVLHAPCSSRTLPESRTTSSPSPSLSVRCV